MALIAPRLSVGRPKVASTASGGSSASSSWSFGELASKLSNMSARMPDTVSVTCSVACARHAHTAQAAIGHAGQLYQTSVLARKLTLDSRGTESSLRFAASHASATSDPGNSTRKANSHSNGITRVTGVVMMSKPRSDSRYRIMASTSIATNSASGTVQPRASTSIPSDRPSPAAARALGRSNKQAAV